MSDSSLCDFVPVVKVLRVGSDFSRVSVSQIVKDWPVPGCCEFAEAPVFVGASGRVCSVDKSICAESNYVDSVVFERCFLRIRELASQKKSVKESI